MRKPGLILIVADLVIAGNAFRAFAASANEGQRHSFPHAPPGYVFPDLDNNPRHLMARYMRQRDIRIVSHPAMPVAHAKAGRLDSQDNATFRRDWVHHILDGQS